MNFESLKNGSKGGMLILGIMASVLPLAAQEEVYLPVGGLEVAQAAPAPESAMVQDPVANETLLAQTPVNPAGPGGSAVAAESDSASDAQARENEVLRKQIFDRKRLGRSEEEEAAAAKAAAEEKALNEAVAKKAAEQTLGGQDGFLGGATMLVPISAGVPAPAAAPTQNVTINLINRLVQKGVLSKEDAADLIKQAEADAALAKMQADEVAQAKAMAAKASGPGGANGSSNYSGGGGSSGGSGSGDGSVRVTYIPQHVKNQMTEEIRQQVMAQAYEENWAQPDSVPEWVKRMDLFGDVRVRYEGDFFPSGNATGFGSNFFNYNAINTSSTPFDITGLALPPYNNVDQDRNRARLRARFGVEADLTNGFSAGLRVATGDSNSPVSPNQSLGAASGQGGNFSKYAIWLDRGFIKYELNNGPGKNFAFLAGRFDNPFFSTDMIWDDDLGFDGFAVTGNYRAADGVTPFGTLGAFPVYNTDFNFSTNQPVKFKSQDKWLFGGQAGVDWKITEDVSWKTAGAFYYFQNVEGKVSSPFVPLTATDAGDTDTTRPSFAQKGNTYIALREIEPDPSNGFGTTNQWQYFGLATPYQLVAFTNRIDVNRWDPFHVWLVGETVLNVAFNRNDINNNGPTNLPGAVNNLTNNSFDGGDLGWFVRLNFGKAKLEQLWDWNAGVGYRYVESDAVIDGFTDSDFGGGGTNLQGFTLAGNVAFSKYVYAGLRWLSADSISGPNYKEDIVQFDLNAKF